MAGWATRDLLINSRLSLNMWTVANLTAALRVRFRTLLVPERPKVDKNSVKLLRKRLKPLLSQKARIEEARKAIAL